MSGPAVLWRIEITAPAAAVPSFEAALEPYCDSLSWFVGEGLHLPWRLEGFATTEPDRQGLERILATAAEAAGVAPPRARVKLVPVRDWAAENLATFPPLAIGRYFIHGSRFQGPFPAGMVPLKLDPGQAFGSGSHASTASCLMVLDDLAKRRFRRPLDLGCGSGILALAMAKTWKVPVLAADADPVSVAVTTLNARANGVGGLVRAIPSWGYAAAEIRRRGPFDLIVANILARPLRLMTKDLVRHLERGGIAILSGFVAGDGNRVAWPHLDLGLRLRRRMVMEEWMTLVLER